MELQLTNIDIPYTFQNRPAPLAGDLRPTWKIGLILLMLLYCRRHKATLQKLHLLNTACNSMSAQGNFLRYIDGKARKDEIIPRIEPSLNRALNLARGEGLIEVESGKNLMLTPKGLGEAKALEAIPDCMATERLFLQTVKSFVTESKVTDLFNWNLVL
jgi:hypothetical protein